MNTSDHVKVVLEHKRVAVPPTLTHEYIGKLNQADSRSHRHPPAPSVAGSRWGGSSLSNVQLINRVYGIKEGLAQIEKEHPNTRELKTADAEIAALRNKVAELEARLDFVAKNSAVNAVSGDIVSELKSQNIDLRIAVKKGEKAVEEIPQLQSQVELAEKKVSYLETQLKAIDNDLKLVRAESDCQQFLYERLGLIAKEFLVALRVAVSKLRPELFQESNSVWKDRLDTKLGELDLNRAVMEVYRLGMEQIGVLNGDDEDLMLDTDTMGILYAAVSWESGGSIDPLMKYMNGTHDADLDVSEGPVSVVERTPVSDGRRLSVGSFPSQFGSPAALWVSPMKGNVSGKVLHDAEMLLKSCTELLLGRETITPLLPTKMKELPADLFEIDPGAAPELKSYIEELNRFKSAVLTVVSKLDIPEGAASFAEYVEGLKAVTQESVKEVRSWYDQLSKVGVDIDQIESVQRTIAELREQIVVDRGELERAKGSAEAFRRDRDFAIEQLAVAEADKKGAEERLVSILDENARLKSGLTRTAVEQIRIRSGFFAGIHVDAAAVRMIENGGRHDLLDNRYLYEFPTGFQSVRRESAIEMLSMFEASAGFLDSTTPIELSPTNFVMSAFYGAPLPSSGGGYVRPAVIRTVLESLRTSSTEQYSIHDLIGLFTESKTPIDFGFTVEIPRHQDTNCELGGGGIRTPKKKPSQNASGNPRNFTGPKIKSEVQYGTRL